MFYKCLKCNKTWPYNIKKCPSCFEEIVKIESNEMNVIACSKINIPTFLHPNIPYFVLLVEDENNNKYVYKSFTEKKIGEKVSYDKIDNAVAIWRKKYDFEEAIRKTLDLINNPIQENTKILILPTLISPNHEYLRENTSSDFIDSVLKIVLEKTPKENIKIVGQSFNDVPIEASAQKSGLLDTCLKYNIIPEDLSKDVFIKQNNLEISEQAIKADLIINLPIMKIGKISATENLFKLLSKNSYSALKYLQSEPEEIIIKQINETFSNKVLTIAEADVVQGIDKFNRYLGLVLASKNYSDIDKVFDVLTMHKDIDINNISIVGRDIKEVQHNTENIC